MANQLGDATLTFPVDRALTPEIIKNKQELITKQYDDRDHDYYAPML